MSALTDRQQAIFDFIVRRVHHEGIPPTLMEIAEAFGLASVAGVADHLKAIERKGFIRRRPGASRGIEVADAALPPRTTSAWLPLAGGVPSAGWRPARSGAPGVVVDHRLASPGAFLVSVSTDSLRQRGLLPDDLLVVAPSHQPGAGSLVLGRQGRHTSLLEISADGRRARALAGRFERSRDVDFLGRVVGVLRGIPPTVATAAAADD